MFDTAIDFEPFFGFGSLDRSGETKWKLRMLLQSTKYCTLEVLTEHRVHIARTARIVALYWYGAISRPEVLSCRIRGETNALSQIERIAI